MKKQLALLLLAIVFAMQGMSGYGQTIQVGQETGTLNYATFRLYNYSSHSQQVYTKQDIIDANGGVMPTNMQITSIAFNYAYTDNTTARRLITIYLKNVTRSSFASNTDYEPLTGATCVLQNKPQTFTNKNQTTPFGNGWLEFAFAEPFIWDGVSNILVEVVANRDGDNTNTWYFDHVTTHQVTATPNVITTLNWYSDGITGYDLTNLSSIFASSGTIVRYRTNTQFTFAAQSNCVKIQGLAAGSIATNAATLSWTAQGTEADWVIEYKPTAIGSWADPLVQRIQATANSYNLTNLAANTAYDVRVRAVCNLGGTTIDDYSDWTTANFRTLADPACSAITQLPWGEDFSATPWAAAVSPGNTIAPNCWINLNGGATNRMWVRGTAGHNGAGCATLSGNTNSDVLNDWLITPIITLSGAEILTYWTHARTDDIDWAVYAYNLSNNGGADITNANDTSLFTLLAYETFQNTPANSDKWFNHQLLLNLAAGDYRFAFVRNKLRGSGLDIDDISITSVPTCPATYNLMASTPTDTSINLSWANNITDGNSWEIAYGPAATFDLNNPLTYTLTPSLASGVTLPYTLSGLNPATNYKIAVRRACAGAAWSNIITQGTTIAEETFGINSWRGYVYQSPTPDVAANRFSGSYLGLITEPAIFERSMQTASFWTGATAMWMGAAPSTNFAVRYKMVYDFPCGDYKFTFTNINDAMRFSIDSGQTWLSMCYNDDVSCSSTNGWSTNLNGSYTTGSTSISLSGTHYLILEYYQANTGAACRFSFAETTPLVITPSDTTPTSVKLAFNSGTNWNLKVSETALTNPATDAPTGTTGRSYLVTTTPHTLSSLTPSTDYYIYAQTACGGNWSNIKVTTAAPCNTPAGLNVTNIGVDTATLQWSSNGMAAWRVKVSTTPLSNPATMPSILDTNVLTNSLKLTQLAPITQYYWYVQTACGSSWSAQATFTTTQVPATLPYFCDFETPATNSGWQFNNGTQTNHWVNGTAVQHGGTASMYISNNHNDYQYTPGGTPDPTSYVYAYRPVVIPTTAPSQKFELLFDWRCQGENGTDVANVYLVPLSANISAGAHNNMNNQYNTTPTGWIHLSGQQYLNYNDNWSTQSTSFTPPTTTGIYNLVFFWKNDATGGAQPPIPIAIDNVGLYTCTSVTNLHAIASSITSDSAQIAWTSTVGSWGVRYCEKGGNRDTATEHIVNTSSYQLSGLQSATTYDVYVHSLCSASDSSRWIKDTVRTAPACPIPNNLSVSAIGPDSVILHWYGQGRTTCLLKVSTYPLTNPDTATSIPNISITSSTYTYHLSGLMPSTTYYWYLQSDCSLDWSAAGMFTTKKMPVILPYTCDFENPVNSGWEFANGTQVNKWIIGSAVHSGAGSKSLYISNNGTGFSYANYDSYVYAYQTIEIQNTGQLEFAFDWRCNTGDLGNDLGRAFLVPANEALTAGAHNGMNANNNTKPATWIDLGGGNLENSANWTTKVTTITAPAPGSYNVVFFWKSNYVTGNGTPIAIDNVSFMELTCPTVTNLTVVAASIAADSAKITWNVGAGETAWDVKFCTANGTPDTATVHPITTQSYSLLGLTAGTAYEVYVRSHCSATNGGRWARVGFTTLNVCPAVTALQATGITHNAANISWTAVGTETQWRVKIVPKDSAHLAYPATPVTNPNFTATAVSGTTTLLFPSTPYDVWVQAYCSANDSSVWVKQTFSTICGEYPLSTMGHSPNDMISPSPWREDFLTYNATYQTNHQWALKNQKLPDCWTSVNNTNQTLAYPYIHPGNRNLDFTGGTTEFASGWNAAVMPQLPNGIVTKQIKIWLHYYNNYHPTAQLRIYMTDQPNSTNLNDYELVRTITMPTATSIQDTIVSFANYRGTAHKHIAFVSYGASVKIDDLLIWLDSNVMCQMPNNLVATTISPDSTSIEWDADGASQWEISYRMQGGTWSSALFVDTNFHLFTNLTPNRRYDVRVRTVCEADDTSRYRTISFNTPQIPCPEIDALQITTVASNSISVTWTAGGNENQWLVSYRPTSGGQTLVDTANTLTHTLNNLAPNTEYSICVKAVCAPESQSADSCITISTTKIKNIDLTHGVKLYPNPATDLLTVSFSGEFKTIEVTNMLGQTLYSGKIVGTQVDLDVSNYVSGIYFVKLQGESGVITRKFARK